MSQSLLVRYGTAALTTVCALLLTLLLQPLIEPSPFPLFFAAVMVSGWFGGLGPGLLAAFVSALASKYFFLPPVHSLAVTTPSTIIRLGAFVLVALAISVLNELRGRAHREVAAQVAVQTAALMQANEALQVETIERRRAEARYRGLLESAPDAIVVVDRAGKIVLVNEQAEQLFGYDRGELLGQPVEVLMPEGLRAQHVQQRADYAAQPRVRPMGIGLNLIGRRRDGSKFPAEISLSPHETDDGLLVTSVIRDVTERRRAEEERHRFVREQAARAVAEEARQRLAFVAEASQIFAASLDYEATLASVARLAVPRLADCCIVDLLDESWSLRKLAVAHADPSREELVREALSRFGFGSGVLYGASNVLTTGQSEIYPEISDALLAAVAHDADHLRTLRAVGARSAMIVPLSAHGRILGAICFVSVSAGRCYEAADLALVEDFAGRAALAVDNATLYQKAQAAVHLRDEILSGVSHDLKQPLVTIKGHAQLLQRRLARSGALSADQAAEGLATIEATATKMTTLINELLDAASLQMGQPLALERSPIDLVALVRQVVVDHLRISDRHRIRAEMAVDKLVGVWDAARLERVLGNLLSNAVKYSSAGGSVTVTVARDDADGSWAVLGVRDQGIGIPAADLPRVFERFYRGKNVAGRIAGTGLGLAGARQIVEQHGGSISVESEEGSGSIFIVRLPLTSDE